MVPADALHFRDMVLRDLVPDEVARALMDKAHAMPRSSERRNSLAAAQKRTKPVIPYNSAHGAAAAPTAADSVRAGAGGARALDGSARRVAEDGSNERANRDEGFPGRVGPPLRTITDFESNFMRYARASDGAPNASTAGQRGSETGVGMGLGVGTGMGIPPITGAPPSWTLAPEISENGTQSARSKPSRPTRDTPGGEEGSGTPVTRRRMSHASTPGASVRAAGPGKMLFFRKWGDVTMIFRCGGAPISICRGRGEEGDGDP